MICRFDIILANAKFIETIIRIMTERKSLHPRRNFVKSFSLFGIWNFHNLLRPRPINFKILCLKRLKEDTLRQEGTLRYSIPLS